MWPDLIEHGHRVAPLYPHQTLTGRLVPTIFWNFVGFLFYSMTICGCHFHLEAAVVNSIPILWAVIKFLTYRTQQDRIVAWVNIGLAAGWFEIAWESNLKFAVTDWLK